MNRCHACETGEHPAGYHEQAIPTADEPPMTRERLSEEEQRDGATARPWRFRMMGSEGGRIFPDWGDIREQGKFIAIVNGRDFHTDQANGELIVTAVNDHSALVEKMRELARELTNDASDIRSDYRGDCIHEMYADVIEDYAKKLLRALGMAVSEGR